MKYRTGNQSFLAFTVVAAAGLLVWFNYFRDEAAVKHAREIPVAATTVADNTQQVSKPIEIQTRVPSNIAHTAPVKTTPGRQIEVAADSGIAEQATTLNLHLDEEILATMERAGSELRQYAAAEPTGEGWRIQLYPADQVFSRAGFHSGDLVTFAGLQARSDNADQARLAQRMVDILRLIER